MRCFAKRSPARGFTLIELMLVLVVMGLLVGLTPPLFEKAFPSLKLKAATRDLAQEMRFIQQSAILTGQVTKVRFDLQNNAYRSDLVNQGETRQLPDGLHFIQDENAVSISGEQILVFEFFPDGSSSGGKLILGNGARRLAISVDWLTSRIRVIGSEELKADDPFQV